MYEDEEWVPIEDFPHYLISSYGRVRHVDRVEPRTPSVNDRGFPMVLLSGTKTATRYLRQINKLVANAFIPKPTLNDMRSVWHIDGDLSNCHVSNLKWETRAAVLEWNEMHRNGPRFSTPFVKNNRTGQIYRNAYECAIAEGVLESQIVFRVERVALNMYDDNARYRYVTEFDGSEHVR